MTYSIFYSTRTIELFCTGIALLALAIALLRPHFAAGFYDSAERFFAGAARNTLLAGFAAAMVPMVLRLALLPVMPFPTPQVHDEFSHLLVADTFAHGRLTNPTPPEWRHFETEYELMRPTYASQYQPAQGLIMAAGQLLTSHPWWGVWLSCGLMCAALNWGLAGILPAGWALFGSIVAALQFGVFGFWMNSYFGGAVAATAGALVFGALVRCPAANSTQKLLVGLIAGIGLAILFASRPAEALIWTAAAICLARAGRTLEWRFALPAVIVLLFAAGGLACYNRAVTGEWLTPPYEAYRDVYGVPQSYWWQPAVIATSFDSLQLAANYNDQLAFWKQRYSASTLFNAERRRARDFWRFFIGPFLTPALLLAPWAARKPSLRPWVWVSVLFILDHATFHAWYPQQSAPEVILIVLFVVEGWRELRKIGVKRPFGLAVSRQLAAGLSVCVLLLSGSLVARASGVRLPPTAARVTDTLSPPVPKRGAAVSYLIQVPGHHLVFMNYGPRHHWYDEWVFNAADLDHSRIIFARMCSPSSDAALARAMSGRDLWIADPDAEPVLRRTTLLALEQRRMGVERAGR